VRQWHWPILLAAQILLAPLDAAMAQLIAPTRLVPQETTKETRGVPIHSARPAEVTALLTGLIHLAQPETIRAILGALTLSEQPGVVMAQPAVLILSAQCVVTKHITTRSSKDAAKLRRLAWRYASQQPNTHIK